MSCSPVGIQGRGCQMSAKMNMIPHFPCAAFSRTFSGPTVCISCGCCNERPPAEQLQTAPLPASSGGRAGGRAPSGGPGGSPSWPRRAPGAPALLGVRGGISLLPASVVTWPASVSLQGHPPLHPGLTLVLLITSAKTPFPGQITFGIVGDGSFTGTRLSSGH